MSMNLDKIFFDYHGYVLDYPIIGLAETEKGKVKVDLKIIFGQRDERKRFVARARFLSKFEDEFIWRGVTYEGDFKITNVKGEDHPYDILHITGEAIAYTREIILDLSGTTEIVNLGYMETPVTITTQGSCTITGLSEKPIKTLSGVTITDDGLILDTNGNNASNSVEMWEFPKLALGKSTVKVTSPVTMTYKVRLI